MPGDDHGHSRYGTRPDVDRRPAETRADYAILAISLSGPKPRSRGHTFEVKSRPS
jgi:hypothetical protein